MRNHYFLDTVRTYSKKRYVCERIVVYINDFNKERGDQLMKKISKLITALMMSLVLLIPGQVLALSAPSTEVPSREIAPLTVFDPNFKYLDSGSGNLSYLGDNKINVWGQTFGTKVMDIIGVQVTLQRWIGSEWIDVNTGPRTTYNNDSYAYFSRDITVSSGYYYRVKSTHWISYGNTKEEGTRYSNFILID